MSSEGGLSIDDPEDVTKGQLLEVIKGQQARIEKLEEDVDQVREDERKDVTNNVFNQLLGALVGPEAIDFVADPMENRDAVSHFGDRVNELEEAVEEADRAAQTALTTAEKGAKPGDSGSKKDVAKSKSRNELLRRLVNTPGTTQSIKVPEVQDMAKPEIVVHYQTVKDAWDELESDWDAFSRGENENGNNVLRVVQDDLEPALVKTVESALGRDDLTKRLITRNKRGGV